ncbi:MAG TPA: MFS transporter [Anaerolineales bacterium]|nr:MFS transporter [Anaerolineales bacterium]HND91771.1 MFS transporter [Anaerolineales bacterium]
MMPPRSTGMRTFTMIWFGQIISLLGSAMTWFAFTIWVWQKTEQASSLAAINTLAFLPSILLMPIAGTFVDKWERKTTLILSDLGSVTATLIALLLYHAGSLALWHIYLLSLFAGIFTAFQYPAYVAATTALVSKDDYARAQGMVGLAQAASTIFAPMIAAALLPSIGLSGIMTIDLLTFVFAFSILLWIKFPLRSDLTPAPVTQTGFAREVSFGFRSIFANPTLRALTILFVVANFFLAIGATLLAPTILSHTANSEGALAAILSVGAAGGLIGGGLLSVWGGPKRKVNGILLGGVAACLIGISLFGLARSVLIWGIASFFFSFFEPFVEGSNTALWQSTVEINAQGRVFSARQLLTQIPYLIGMAGSGWFAELGIARFTGTQNGIHLSTTLVLAGLAGSAVFIIGYFVPPIREIQE